MADRGEGRREVRQSKSELDGDRLDGRGKPKQSKEGKVRASKGRFGASGERGRVSCGSPVPVAKWVGYSGSSSGRGGSLIGL